MKKIMFIALAIIMVGCAEREEPNEKYYQHHHWIEVIDSCEYLPHFGHKGNCKYCAERRKQEMRQLIIELKSKNKED